MVKVRIKAGPEALIGKTGTAIGFIEFRNLLSFGLEINDAVVRVKLDEPLPDFLSDEYLFKPSELEEIEL